MTEEPLEARGPTYAHVYAGLAAALTGSPYEPPAEAYARDIATIRAAYASARGQREVRLDSPELAVS